MPPPVPEPKKARRTKHVPPNPVYTSPESMKFIQQKDKDANINFDEDLIVCSTTGAHQRGRGRGIRRSSYCDTSVSGGRGAANVEQGTSVNVVRGRGRGRARGYFYKRQEC